jgi:hypothetical protein
MADLSAKPSLDHLRRQARDLLRAARAGDTTAAGRIRAVADALTLASAQLAVAVRRKHSARPASVTARAGRPGCWRPLPSSPATASPPR